MADTLTRVKMLAGEGNLRISAHGYDELAADDILVEEVLAGLATGILIEDYPTAAHGPCVLVLQKDAQQRSVHAVWGIPKDQDGPAVLVTAYRPDPSLWTADLTQRKKT
jgi:hypothetical protein